MFGGTDEKLVLSSACIFAEIRYLLQKERQNSRERLEIVNKRENEAVWQRQAARMTVDY